MNEFEPGPGWREVQYGTETESGGWIMQSIPGGQDRYWVREAPVPPLPTVPYTVIRALFPGGSERLLLLDSSGAWCYAREHGDLFEGDPELTQAEVDDIKSFKVLSEPRAVTAKAVLDRVRGYTDYGPLVEADIAREFGVES